MTTPTDLSIELPNFFINYFVLFVNHVTHQGLRSSPSPIDIHTLNIRPYTRRPEVLSCFVLPNYPQVI